jgi:hypothetical protein
MITSMFGSEPKFGESIFDSNPRRELERDFMLDATTRQELKTMLIIKPKVTEVSLDSHVAWAMGFGFNTIGDMGSPALSRASSQLSAGLVSQLREYRQELHNAARSISDDLRMIDLWFYACDNSLVAVQSKSYAELAKYESQVSVCVPSLDPYLSQTQYYECVRDELLNHEARRTCWTRTFLQKELIGVKQALRLVGTSLAVIQSAIIPAIFCSVLWEERRWFLFHGARPPRASVQAMSGLLAGACSGLLIAS